MYKALKTVGVVALAGFLVNTLGKTAQAKNLKNAPAPAVSKKAPATAPKIKDGMNVFNNFASIDIGGKETKFSIFNRGAQIDNNNYTISIKNKKGKVISNPVFSAATWKSGGLEIIVDALAFKKYPALIPEGKAKDALKKGAAGSPFSIAEGDFTIEFTKI